MSLSDDDRWRAARALLRPDLAEAAARFLAADPGRIGVEGLVELLHREHPARAGVAAVAALAAAEHPLAADGLAAALRSPHATVRLDACQALRGRVDPPADGALERLLREDPSWPVRRAALEALAAGPGSEDWRILTAASEPHWRVRHALIRVLLERGRDDGSRRRIDERLTDLESLPQSKGVRLYLRWRWKGEH